MMAHSTDANRWSGVTGGYGTWDYLQRSYPSDYKRLNLEYIIQSVRSSLQPASIMASSEAELQDVQDPSVAPQRQAPHAPDNIAAVVLSPAAPSCQAEERNSQVKEVNFISLSIFLGSRTCSS